MECSQEKQPQFCSCKEILEKACTVLIFILNGESVKANLLLIKPDELWLVLEDKQMPPFLRTNQLNGCKSDSVIQTGLSISMYNKCTSTVPKHVRNILLPRPGRHKDIT